ncbi:MAG TPA: nucleotidyl transferase AbiEii/AbiGii toxin family protein [Oscillatoriaceae cyanobacterium M33_DOE_052]|uniref:Nucleotidyl transferase AbiEii/AbiGii toxin family protein n=1 Tax=Planktothricoides sp. SpSt-374 TaxID=2282167 RepID=A0A7C3VN77_9CYAN|nr:nucleotidyl transferase AbiEii/AbiGii toxin family protein [Oscillatoriaceae cyanobacterium M33_DOE_052]
MNSPRNLAASVRQRLLNLAKEQTEDFQAILTRYVLERLLYRLSQSPYRDRFILKGAILFSVWSNQPHRATRDIDLLGYGDNTIQNLQQIFQDICRLEVEEDGLEFQAETVKGTTIKEKQEYGGVRVNLTAIMEKARIPIQIDIGCGDAVTPAPVEEELPTLLKFPCPKLRIYPRETVIAEKFHAMVTLGIANSRMKDFYDIWFLAQNFPFSGVTLSQAIKATFDRRTTKLPARIPLALTLEFAEDAAKLAQWQAFLKKGKLTANPLNLSEVIAIIDKFLMPPNRALVLGESFNYMWLPGGNWQ